MGYWTEGGRRMGVLGLGLSGRAASRLLASLGFEVVGLDESPDAGCRYCSELITGTESVLDSLAGMDGLVISPGIDPRSGIPGAAAEMGLPLIGEIELAFRNSRTPVLAVTGSNGKTTTSEWLGHVLRCTGRNAVVAGNTGYPFSSAVLENPGADCFVLEVSSYQLQTVELFHPIAAAILNITPDHLQRHGDMDGYREAKARVFMNLTTSDILVLNGDDPGSIPLSGRTEGQELLFSVDGPVADGAFFDGEFLYTSREGSRSRIMPVSEVSLPGRHNLANALAVACLAGGAGLSSESMAKGLGDFPGVRHRIESLGQVGGVEWVNDSKSTNLEALEVALESFPDGVILIAGGRGKKTDYSRLRELISRRVHSMVLIGEAADTLERAWAGAAPIYREPDLEAAVHRARKIALPGSTVLLSPACASFDQYRNFEERGDHFRSVVGALS